ncbi:glycosyltransferase [Caballeronia ptereochthonis]|uniref:Teichuronic acid biosynthesis glycosyltransferase TuaC n=1 Tax=Caballeronia ptereochthonis TaxID=1777144 RepID=A0A158A6X6_9BURK|nr:glycosyltransferase [Caballeronia ptereochthonis]SAK53523.1 Putative teichuronic acid biosynthesis glycosyltransferase TuaC [Caballeronia ptereochthonis]
MQFNIENLESGLEARPYVTHRYHEFLNADSGRREGPNIGLNGEHLTITFLSLNRSRLSIKLCRSIADQIPNFKGEVLVIDNGSSEEEREALRRYLEGMPFRWRIEVLGQNYGVAGGRNRTMPHVRTEWVMSLDNDVYFIKNPLPEIQHDLAVLGCHFMTMAVLNEDANTNFIRGGHLYLTFDMNEFIIGGGTAHRQSHTGYDGPGYLGTFMSGCASVFRKDSFLAQGGFDEGMFVGFEDFEFSVRLFRAGLKVGASDVRALVHDHLKPETTDDKDYERARFARARLEAAAVHFEKKHGYKVWTDGVDTWVRQREQDLGLDVHNGRQRDTVSTGSGPRRPRVALIVDMNTWALANIARQIIKYVSDEFEFDILTSQDVEQPTMLLEMTKEHDLVHYLWREPLSLVCEPWERQRIDQLYGSWNNFVSQVIAPRPITLTVFDHLFLTQAEIEHRIPLFTQLSNGYTVSSRILQRIYQGIPSYPNPDLETPDGVDLTKFKPAATERFIGNEHRPLRVGWSGNSAWGTHTEEGRLRDPKGFHTILRPALDQLKSRGIVVDEYFADRQIRQISHDRMPDYYNALDVLICCSEAEGTPNPVLEAMACGVPVITTNVGIVSEAFGPQQKHFILKERDAVLLADAIEELVKKRHLLHVLSQENLQWIKRWDWSIRTDAYRRLFRHHIKARQPARLPSAHQAA